MGIIQGLAVRGIIQASFAHLSRALGWFLGRSSSGFTLGRWLVGIFLSSTRTPCGTRLETVSDAAVARILIPRLARLNRVKTVHGAYDGHQVLLGVPLRVRAPLNVELGNVTPRQLVRLHRSRGQKAGGTPGPAFPPRGTLNKTLPRKAAASPALTLVATRAPWDGVGGCGSGSAASPKGPGHPLPARR